MSFRDELATLIGLMDESKCESYMLPNPVFYTVKEHAFLLAAEAFICTHATELQGLAAERDSLAYELADVHDSIRTAYRQCPDLPVRVETMDWATDALHDLCLIVGIHGVSVPPPNSPIHDAALASREGLGNG